MYIIVKIHNIYIYIYIQFTNRTYFWLFGAQGMRKASELCAGRKLLDARLVSSHPGPDVQGASTSVLWG